jgi:hypothetical protein
MCPSGTHPDESQPTTARQLADIETAQTAVLFLFNGRAALGSLRDD